MGAQTRSVVCPFSKLGTERDRPGRGCIQVVENAGHLQRSGVDSRPARTAPIASWPFRLCAAAATASGGSLEGGKVREMREFCASSGVSPGMSHSPGLKPELRAKFPHLANLAAFRLPPGASAAAAQSLKGQLAIGAVRGVQGVDATSLQLPGVLDELYYAKDGPIRLARLQNEQATLRVWAPTARS